MRKKLSGLALFFASILILVACSNNNAPLSSDTNGNAPWSAALEIGSSEVVTYSITKELVDVNSGDRTLAGTGAATFSVSNVKGDYQYPRSQLDFEFVLENNEKSLPIDRGKTDKISSSVEFQNSAMAPIYSHKEVNIAERTDENGNTTNTSYKIDTNYDIEEYDGIPKETSRYTAHGKDSKDMKLGGFENVFDNESLFYVIRSLKNMTLNKAISLNVAVPKDMFDHDKYAIQNLQLKSGPQINNAPILKSSKLNIDNLSDKYDDTDKDKENAANGLYKGSVPSIDSTIAINNPLSGLPIIVRYAADPLYIKTSTDDEGNQITKLDLNSENKDAPHIDKLLINFLTQRFVNKDTLEVITYNIDSYDIIPFDVETK